MTKSDFILANYGSFMVLQPQTKEALDWRDKNLPEDALEWCTGVVIEPRYVEDILTGILADDLTVEDEWAQKIAVCL